MIKHIPLSLLLLTHTHTHTHTHTDPTVKSADHQQVSTTTATQLYENTELPSSSPSTDQDNKMYEEIELSTTTDHDIEIKLSQNAAYGKVQR